MKKGNIYLRIAVLTGSVIALILCILFVRLRGSVSIKAPSGKEGYEQQEDYFFAQADPAWAEQRLGSSEFTMDSSGCLTSCIASALILEELAVDGISGTNPGMLNLFLTDKQVYDKAGNIRWEPLEKALGLRVVRSSAGEVKADGLTGLLNRHVYPIVRVRVKMVGNFHYVVIVKAEEGEYWCMDPLNEEKILVPLSEFGNRIYAVRYIERLG